EKDDIYRNERTDSTWLPFKKKEIMIGCLIARFTRSLMSQKTYDHICMVIQLCDVDLPAWKTVQSAKAKLKKKAHCKNKLTVSVLGNPMTTISIQSLLTQELGNPLVSNYLDFYPEDAQGKSIFKLSQSVKWLHQYSRDLRVQMI
ncbi:hypothetical protein PPACK8108_LOCUS13301, partial [Phakopsora pachyrhizi]